MNNGCCFRYRLRLCTNTFIRKQVRSHALALICSVLLAIISSIADPICNSFPENRCVFASVPLGAWLRFVAFATFLSPPCRLLDHFVFSLLAEAGGILARHSETLSTAFFYISALEEALGRFLWLLLIYAYILGTNTISGAVGFSSSNQSSFIEKLLTSILLYQILSILRNITVRVATRSLLISSFESKTTDTIFAMKVILGLSLPHWVKRLKNSSSSSSSIPTKNNSEDDFILLKAGKAGGSFDGDEAHAAIAEYLDLSLLHDSHDLRRKLDAVSSLNLLMYSSSGTNFNDPGKVVSVVTKEELVRISSATFRDLHSIPKNLLPQVVLESEEILGEEGPENKSNDTPGVISRGSAEVSVTFRGSSSLQSQQEQQQQQQPQSPRNTMVSQLSFRRSSIRGRASSLFPGGLDSVAGTDMKANSFILESIEESGQITDITTSSSNLSESVHSPQNSIAASVSLPPVKLQKHVRNSGSERPRLSLETFGHTSADPWAPQGELSVPQMSNTDDGQGSDVAASNSIKSSSSSSSTHDISGKFNASVTNFSSIGAQVGKEMGKLARQLLDLTAEDKKNSSDALFTDLTGIALTSQESGENEEKSGLTSKIQRGACARINTPVLCIRHFAAVMPLSGEDLERAFALFDSEGVGEITLQVFIESAGRLMDDLNALKASLDGSNQSAVAAVSSLVNVVFFVMFCFGLIFVFDLNPASVIVPLGTVFVSASFAIGPTLANVISSIILVLITRPFDVGDRLYASDILEGKELLLVQRIELLSTTFTRSNNRLLTSPNWKLLSMNIENLRRSPNVVAKLEFSIPFETSARQLENVRLRLDHYIKANTNEWRPGSERVRAVGIDGPSIKIVIFVTSRVMWSDVSRLFKMNHSLWLHVCASLNHEGIRFKSPDVRVSIEGPGAMKT
jgi:small-conductance mechanosensitive channel